MSDLTHAARDYAQARHDAEVARVALVAAIRAAAAAGEPETRIAERAGVARMTVRKALGKNARRALASEHITLTLAGGDTLNGGAAWTCPCGAVNLVPTPRESGPVTLHCEEEETR